MIQNSLTETSDKIRSTELSSESQHSAAAGGLEPARAGPGPTKAEHLAAKKVVAKAIVRSGIGVERMPVYG